MYSTTIEERKITRQVKDAAGKLESELVEEVLKEDEELMHSSVVRTDGEIANT